MFVVQLEIELASNQDLDEFLRLLSCRHTASPANADTTALVQRLGLAEVRVHPTPRMIKRLH